MIVLALFTSLINYLASHNLVTFDNVAAGVVLVASVGLLACAMCIGLDDLVDSVKLARTERAARRVSNVSSH